MAAGAGAVPVLACVVTLDTPRFRTPLQVPLRTTRTPFSHFYTRVHSSGFRAWGVETVYFKHARAPQTQLHYANTQRKLTGFVVLCLKNFTGFAKENQKSPTQSGTFRWTKGLWRGAGEPAFKGE